MSCSPFDLRDFFLKELASPQQLQVEAHVKTCMTCRDEVERLRVTEAALFSLRDEEVPQRIGFVSDQIFEPSPFRRWLTAFWGSTARLGFASAAVLSAAITFSAWQRTPAPAPVVSTTGVSAPVVAALTPQQIDQRVQEAVAKAVADVEAHYAEKTAVQAAAFQRETDLAQQKLQFWATRLEMAERRSNNLHASNMVTGLPEPGDPK